MSKKKNFRQSSDDVVRGYRAKPLKKGEQLAPPPNNKVRPITASNPPPDDISSMAKHHDEQASSEDYPNTDE